MTEHFALEEFTHSDTANSCGIDNTAPPEVEAELERLMLVMEEVRIILDDQPITITSGYRCLELNAEVNGAADSAHCSGRACDFVCPTFGTPLDICKRLEPYLFDLGVDQLIHEYDGWVHLAIAPVDQEPFCECLTIDDTGAHHGFA